jgi:hypothetical protein
LGGFALVNNTAFFSVGKKLVFLLWGLGTTLLLRNVYCNFCFHWALLDPV